MVCKGRDKYNENEITGAPVVSGLPFVKQLINDWHSVTCALKLGQGRGQKMKLNLPTGPLLQVTLSWFDENMF